MTWEYPGANRVSEAARTNEGCVLTRDLRAAIQTTEALLTILPRAEESDSKAAFVRALRDDLVRWVNALNDPYWDEEDNRALPYPEHEKLSERLKLSEVTQRLGEALEAGTTDRLGRQYALTVHTGVVDAIVEGIVDEIDWYSPVSNYNEAFAHLFGIDTFALEDEKRAMIADLRRGTGDEGGTA